MTCPICESEEYQNILGRMGPRFVYRCGRCGFQYSGDGFEADFSMKQRPVVSRSEWGSFRDDGSIDMKVLRNRAEGAVRFFNNGNPRKEMQSNVFGYPFSIIDNGRLVDVDNAYRGNVIIRCLSYNKEGYYSGKVTLSYNDDYNDGRGQGGSGCVLIGDVRDVCIRDGYLVISGLERGTQLEYRYLIQESPDVKAFVRPMAKKRVSPDPGRTLDDFDDNSEEPALPPFTSETKDSITWAYARDPVTGFRCSITKDRAKVTFETYYWFDNPSEEDLLGREHVDRFPTFSDALAFLEGMNGIAYDMMGTRAQDRSDLMLVPKQAKDVKRTKTPTEKRSKKSLKPKTKKKEQVFEVRVDGEVKGSFSSLTKAERMRKELKSKGLKAKIVGVYC